MNIFGVGLDEKELGEFLHEIIEGAAREEEISVPNIISMICVDYGVNKSKINSALRSIDSVFAKPNNPVIFYDCGEPITRLNAEYYKRKVFERIKDATKSSRSDMVRLNEFGRGVSPPSEVIYDQIINFLRK